MKYAKAVVSALIAAAAAAYAVLNDGQLTAQEVVFIVMATLNTLSVWATPNTVDPPPVEYPPSSLLHPHAPLLLPRDTPSAPTGRHELRDTPEAPDSGAMPH